MTIFQSEKQIVMNFYRRLDAVPSEQIGTVLQSTVRDDYLWFGFHPFNKIRGGEAVAACFWIPLKAALTSMQRRMDIFFAGKNRLEGDDSVWVVSMGHLMGLFDKAWLGIQPTGKIMNYNNQSISMSDKYLKKPSIPRPNLLDKILFRISPSKFF